MSKVVRSNLIDLTVQLVHETDKAVLVNAMIGNSENTWLPKYLIEIDKTANPGFIVITLPEYIALEKELI